MSRLPWAIICDFIVCIDKFVSVGFASPQKKLGSQPHEENCLNTYSLEGRVIENQVILINYLAVWMTLPNFANSLKGFRNINMRQPYAMTSRVTSQPNLTLMGEILFKC